MKFLDDLEAEECDFLSELFEQNSALKKIYNFSQGLIELLSKREANKLPIKHHCSGIHH